jgi:hypothetical protein
MNELRKIILVILLSSVKFVAGPSFAYYNKQYDFSFFQTIFYCVLGGMLGVVLFTYFSTQLFRFWAWLKFQYRKLFQRKEIFTTPLADVDTPLKVNYEYVEGVANPKKVFTKRNRKIVQLWKKYGLGGIALITPILLSIPLGTLIANSFVDNKKKIILYMFISLVFWSVLMTTSFEIFHAATVRDLQNQISK